MRKLILSAVAAASLVSALPASAAVITVNQGSMYQSGYDVGSVGTGRGVGFTVDETFSIASLGFDLSVTQANGALYTYEIFSSTDGHTAGGLLASTTFGLGVGNGWMDQLLNFTFNAGSAYVVNFSRVDNGNLAGIGTHYTWESTSGSWGVKDIVDYGPFRTVEGFEGAAPDNSNPLIPFVRFTTGAAVGAVPEPGTWAMMLLGFGGIGMTMRRRRVANKRTQVA